MTTSRFFQLLALVTLAAALCAALAHYTMLIAYALPLTVGTILLFIGFSIGLFFLGQRTADADNKMLFTNVVMGLTMIKMFLCGGLIGAYAYLAEPTNKLFVVPFFATYLIYTSFEVVFLMKLAGKTQKPAPQKEGPQAN